MVEGVGEVLSVCDGWAPGFDGGEEGDVVGAAKLVREGFLVGWEEFVSGGDNGDFWDSGGDDIGSSDGGEESEVSSG